MAAQDKSPGAGSLAGIRVIELADEQAEYCGLTLAGLGADVIKVEPPGGSPTRRIGPFYQDKADPEGSLFFWLYNRGKRSIVLDLKQEKDRARLRELIAGADILLESTPKGELDGYGLSAATLKKEFPALIHARVTPFGDDGPWANFKASDLIHLALGGVMMNCGYDPAPDGKYNLPPIAPQMWHAYHIAGEQLTMAIVAALLYRFRTGQGQQVSCAIHEAIAKSTEVDLMTWVMRRAPILRQTCRHARESVAPNPSIAHTKDGRWVMASLGNREDDPQRLVALMEKHGMTAGFDPETAAVAKGGRFVPGTGPVTRSVTKAWRRSSVSCARSHTKTFRGARRRRRGCCARRCASRTKTRSTRTGSRARASRTSSIRNWVARSAMPRASGSALRTRGRWAVARRCSTKTPIR